jgi:hypothetical protein
VEDVEFPVHFGIHHQTQMPLTMAMPVRLPMPVEQLMQTQTQMPLPMAMPVRLPMEQLQMLHIALPMAVSMTIKKMRVPMLILDWMQIDCMYPQKYSVLQHHLSQVFPMLPLFQHTQHQATCLSLSTD